MATWLTHLRVADKIFDRFYFRNRSLFFVGCIAPDTVVPPDISHWCTNGDKTTCDTVRFYSKYLEGRFHTADIDFYIGYYVHLLTDVSWHRQKIAPLKKYDRNVIRDVKSLWKDADYEFLSENRNFRPIMMISKAAGLEKKWFDYYSIDEISKLTKYIISSVRALQDTEAAQTAKAVEDVKGIGKIKEIEDSNDIKDITSIKGIDDIEGYKSYFINSDVRTGGVKVNSDARQEIEWFIEENAEIISEKLDEAGIPVIQR